MLALDAAAAPFLALSPPAEATSGVRSVVLMHHKRLPELEATLRRLAAAAAHVATPERPVRVHVAQSLRPSEAQAANATRALLESLAAQRALQHLDLWHAPALLPIDADSPDGSSSVDAGRYGTKKNSFRNMVRGLDAVFGAEDGDSDAPSAAAAAGTTAAGGGADLARAARRGARRPPPAFAIVMEDDVEVSLDLFEYFEAVAGLIDGTRHLPAPQRVALGTSFCILRAPHRDYGHKGWLPGDWLRLRPDRYRRLPLRDVTFKTFAWLATREVYETMRRDTQSMFQLPGTARELHASLRGCSYCENFCYDHYLEWRFRNESLVCPEMPRSRQYVLGRGGGMTERPGSVVDDHHAKERSGTLLNEDDVRSWQHADGAARQRARRLLNGLALWALPAALAVAAGGFARGWLRSWFGARVLRRTVERRV